MIALLTPPLRRQSKGRAARIYRDCIKCVVKERQANNANLHLADGLAMVSDLLFLLATDRVHHNGAGMN
jgi:hypothetical protein